MLHLQNTNILINYLFSQVLTMSTSKEQLEGHFYQGAVLFHPGFSRLVFFFLFSPLKLENPRPLDKELHSKTENTLFGTILLLQYIFVVIT